MAEAEDVRALEALCPWLREDFQAGLAALTDPTAVAARQYAADARLLAGLAAQVPRCALDEVGATPWTSFRREVAVARRVSDQAAAIEIRAAGRLTTVLPHTMDLLEAGEITVARAQAFLAELDRYDDELVGQLDADLALGRRSCRAGGSRRRSAGRCCGWIRTPPRCVTRPPPRAGGCRCSRSRMGRAACCCSARRCR